MTRVGPIAKKEFIQTFRDRRMVVIIFLAPILQLFIFGYAATTDVRGINLAVVDHDRSAESRRLVEAFAASGYFTVVENTADANAMSERVARGGVDAGLVIPADYGRDLARGETAVVQTVFDAADSNFAQIAAGYARGIVQTESARRAAVRAQTARAHAAAAGIVVPDPPSVTPDVRVWFNPELKSAFYMVPGVICMLLMIVTMMLSSLAITREREIGTIEQVIVSPIARWELILGKLTPFAIMGMIDVGIITLVGVAHFGVPIRGSVALLFGASALFLFSTLGLGLFLSAVSATQQQAMFTAFMVIMPAILLSGFMFPIANMPRAAQWITYLNPLRYFLEVIRGIFLKGNGVDVLWPQLAALAAFGVVIFTLTSSMFSRRVG